MVDKDRKLFGFLLNNYWVVVREDSDTSVAYEDYHQRYVLVQVENGTLSVVFDEKSIKEEIIIRSLIIEDHLYLITSQSLKIFTLDDFSLVKRVNN
jgi:hypothetical protein